MALEKNKAYSKVGSIAHIEALASVLSTTTAELLDLSENIPSLWKPGKILRKKDGNPRHTHDARKPLKVIHERIKKQLLKQVEYPHYILGGISDKQTPRDYFSHAALHTKKKILISEDIRDLESLPKAEDKIAFDKFHVAKYLGEAVDKVRRQEHKTLMAEGYEDLKGSKYDWLTNPQNMTRKQKHRFKALRDSTLKTARAWAIKELAMSLWHYGSKTWAYKGWKRWLSWAVRCRLEPIKKVAKTIKEHLWGVLNAIVLKVSNGPAEGLNSRIKMIKVRSRGFRNKERFANAIYFHLGGLDLYPEGITR